MTIEMKTNRPDLELLAEQNKIKLVEHFRQANIHNQNVVRIGYMLYVDGDLIRASNEIREKLKTGVYDGLKFRYAPKRKSFVWSPLPYRGKGSKLSIEQIAEKYGYSGEKT